MLGECQRVKRWQVEGGKMERETSPQSRRFRTSTVK